MGGRNIAVVGAGVVGMSAALCLQRDGHKVSEEELVRFANRNMAHFMVPRFVHFIDALPKTASEKIEKYKLKTWAEQNRTSLWDREAVGLKLER